MQRARLGVVEDADTENEREGRGVRELEERAADRGPEDELARGTGDLAAAGIRFRDELLEIHLSPRAPQWRRWPGAQLLDPGLRRDDVARCRVTPRHLIQPFSR